MNFTTIKKGDVSDVSYGRSLSGRFTFLGFGIGTGGGYFDDTKELKSMLCCETMAEVSKDYAVTADFEGKDSNKITVYFIRGKWLINGYRVRLYDPCIRDRQRAERGALKQLKAKKKGIEEMIVNARENGFPDTVAVLQDVIDRWDSM